MQSIERDPSKLNPYPFVLIALYLSFFAKCGLIYATNQFASKENTTFSAVWGFCKTKIKSILGFYLLNFPLVLLAVFIPELFRLSELNFVLAWVVDTIISFLVTSFFTLSICTIAINNLDAGLGLFYGFLIMYRKFFHIVILISVYILIQILLTWLTGNVLLGVILIVPLTVTMTLAYREFVTGVSYLMPSNPETTA
jgi:hypothetical protein